jgi:23S rRNA (adenine2503-C2)-methyltransferase
MKILESKIDQSVNFVEDALIGFTESRYVRKVDDYFIAYLSSQTGCNRGCTFCHLTATKQTRSLDCDHQDFMQQARTVMAHYTKDRPAKYVHMNFMARGEPLANRWFTENATELLMDLGKLSLDHGVKPKFNISTIMPVTMRRRLIDMFPIITPTIYFSMYSADDAWRKRWMPAAMPIDEAIEQLKEYQSISKKIIKVHGAFIKGENDHPDQIDAMIDKLGNLNIEFNIVRYNPLTPDQGVESPEGLSIQCQLNEHFPTKIIPRVGFDVKASCGMFVN